MRLPFFACLALAALSCGVARADVCFTVLDGAGHVMRQSRRAPVDMSRPISETLYSRYPGASVMVFGTNNDACQEISRVAAPVQAPARRTGRRM